MSETFKNLAGTEAVESEYDPNQPSPEQVSDSYQKARIIADTAIENIAAILPKDFDKEKLGEISKEIHDAMMAKLESEQDTFGEPLQTRESEAAKQLSIGKTPLAQTVAYNPDSDAHKAFK